MTCADITIAVTVYNRRDYVLDAVRSALGQSAPVRVMVFEDCGPDPALRDFILREFGEKVEYIRNSNRRGLFGNWNACIEGCRTSFLSILHDDDLLRPNFSATMVELAKAAPGRALYHGEGSIIDGRGGAASTPSVTWQGGWRDIDLVEFADLGIPMYFAGNLFSVEAAKEIDGVRPNSYYTGDWDFWFRLAMSGGAVQTATVVADVRDHLGHERGTTRVDRAGWRWALENVQRKRNLALLARDKAIHVRFDRARHLRGRPIPSRVLLRNSKNYSLRILKYNGWLLMHSKAPNFAYGILQRLLRLFGPKMLKLG